MTTYCRLFCTLPCVCNTCSTSQKLWLCWFHAASDLTQGCFREPCACPAAATPQCRLPQPQPTTSTITTSTPWKLINNSVALDQTASHTYNTPITMADREQPYDPYIPSGGAGGQQAAGGQNGNMRTAALQAVRSHRIPPALQSDMAAFLAA